MTYLCTFAPLISISTPSFYALLQILKRKLQIETSNDAHLLKPRPCSSWLGFGLLGLGPHWSCLLTKTLDFCLVKPGSTYAPCLPPSFAAIHLKNLQRRNGAAAADRTPTPKSVTESPITKSNTQELSRNREPVLSQYTQELASVEKKIWTCVPQKFVGKLLYTWTLSLSWLLQTWTRGSHPAVHVPSSGASLTWALLLTLLWLSYLCMILLSA